MDALLPRPPDQAKVFAPEAVSVVLFPLQIVVTPLITAVGSGLTETVLTAEAVQPASDVTVTEY